MAIQEIRNAWQAIRLEHKQTVERIVGEVEAGTIPADVALVDIQGVTEQATVGSRAGVLYTHGMISEATFEGVKNAE